MIVTCPKCSLPYDDASRWTICPHNILESAPDAPYYNCGNGGYCRAHDLFNCQFTTFRPPSEDGADDDTPEDETHVPTEPA